MFVFHEKYMQASDDDDSEVPVTMTIDAAISEVLQKSDGKSAQCKLLCCGKPQLLSTKHCQCTRSCFDTSVPPARNVCVLDSSFNPPTMAHFQLLVKAHQAVKFTDKSNFGANMHQRGEMMYALYQSLPQHIRKSFMIGFTDQSLFVNKAQMLANSFPVGTRFFFIMGTDTIARVIDPKYYDDYEAAMGTLFKQAEILVLTRDGYDHESVLQLVPKQYAQKLRLIELDKPFDTISSTQVRNAFKANDKQALEQLLPVQVANFLESTPIYS